MGVAHEESRQSRPAWDGGSLRGGIDAEPAVDPKASLAAAPEALRIHPRHRSAFCSECAPLPCLSRASWCSWTRRLWLHSNVLIALEFLFATAGCLGSTSRQNAETRALWILVAFGFLLSIAGQILDTYDLVMKVPQAAASLPDYLFLVYGIPILLAISFTDDEADLRVLFWLDGAQGIVAAILVYFQIFSTLPWAGHSTAISATSLMYVYDVENLSSPAPSPCACLDARLQPSGACISRCRSISGATLLWP